MPSPKPHTEKKLADAVSLVLSYFDYFEYPLTQKEIHTYISEKVSRKDLSRVLDKLIENKIIDYDPVGLKYTLQGHSMYVKKSLMRQETSKKKLNQVQMYHRLLSYLPWIHFIGISGSCSMLNADEDHDIDYFIISAERRLWLTRLTAICLAKLLRKHRKRGMKNVKDTVCLNLFFDESDLRIPKSKRSLYTAHEVVQMNPVYSYQNAYEKFLHRNAWVVDYFPNIEIQAQKNKRRRGTLPILGNIAEHLARMFQQRIMGSQTNELITSTQLWFFPDDFKQKLPEDLVQER